MRPLRMGYVGAGGMMAQQVHIPNILLLEDCQLLAIAEIRPKLGKQVQEHFRVPKLYADHHELAADPEIEAVAVSGQFAAQGEIAIDMLGAGKDVFMEKPMAVTVGQAERILEAEQASGKRLMIGYMKRYDAGNERVHELLRQFRASGELGELRYVRNHGFGGDWVAGLDTPRLTSDEPLPPAPDIWPDWCTERLRKGYISYLQQYTHNLNLVRWFLGAGGDVDVTTVDLDPSPGLSGVVLLRAAGVRCAIESGNLPYPGWEEHTQIYFEKGWIRTDAPPLLLRNASATVEVFRGDAEEKAISQVVPARARTWSYKEEMAHFVDCLRTGSAFRSPASDTIHDVRILEGIYRRLVEQHA